MILQGQQHVGEGPPSGEGGRYYFGFQNVMLI